MAAEQQWLSCSRPAHVSLAPPASYRCGVGKRELQKERAAVARARTLHLLARAGSGAGHCSPLPQRPRRKRSPARGSRCGAKRTVEVAADPEHEPSPPQVAAGGGSAAAAATDADLPAAAADAVISGKCQSRAVLADGPVRRQAVSVLCATTIRSCSPRRPGRASAVTASTSSRGQQLAGDGRGRAAGQSQAGLRGTPGLRGQRTSGGGCATTARSGRAGSAGGG